MMRRTSGSPRKARSCERIRQPCFELVGSERGLRGAFNGALLMRLDELSQEASDPDTRIIAVGHKLCVRVERDPRVSTLLIRATVVEEVESALAALVEALTESGLGIHSLSALYQDPDRGEVVVAPLVPPFEAYPEAKPRYPHPPLHNLAPERLVGELADLDLFAGVARDLVRVADGGESGKGCTSDRGAGSSSAPDARRVGSGGGMRCGRRRLWRSWGG